MSDIGSSNAVFVVSPIVNGQTSKSATREFKEGANASPLSTPSIVKIDEDVLPTCAGNEFDFSTAPFEGPQSLTALEAGLIRKSRTWTRDLGSKKLKYVPLPDHLSIPSRRLTPQEGGSQGIGEFGDLPKYDEVLSPASFDWKYDVSEDDSAASAARESNLTYLKRRLETERPLVDFETDAEFFEELERLRRLDDSPSSSVGSAGSDLVPPPKVRMSRASKKVRRAPRVPLRVVPQGNEWGVSVADLEYRKSLWPKDDVYFWDNLDFNDKDLLAQSFGVGWVELPRADILQLLSSSRKEPSVLRGRSFSEDSDDEFLSGESGKDSGLALAGGDHFLNGLRESLTSFAKTIRAPPAWGLGLMIFCDAVWTARDARQICNAVLAYLNSLGALSGVFTVIWESIFAILQTFNLVSLQDSEEPDGFFVQVMKFLKASGVNLQVEKLWNLIVDSHLFVALSAVFQGLFDMAVPSTWRDFLKNSTIKRGDFDGLLMSLVEIIKECVKQSVAWSRGERVGWFKGGSYLSYINTADELEASESSRSSMQVDLAAGEVVAKRYESDLIACIELGQTFMLTMAETSRGAYVASRQLKLKKILETLQSMLAKVKRVPRPFICALGGPPGLGKSIFGAMILDEIADSRGMFLPGQPKDATPFVWFPAAAKHCDGFNNKKLVMLDDIGALGIKSEATQEEVMRLMRFGTNIPTVMAMADVTDKGKFYSDVYGVVLTSNLQDFGFSSIPHHGAAVRRVNLFITLSVKPQFAMAGNPEAVDPEKVPNSERCRVWNIIIRKYRTLPTHPYACVDGGPVLLCTENTAEAMTFIRQMASKHHANELIQLTSMKRTVEERQCNSGTRWVMHTTRCCEDCDYSVDGQAGFYEYIEPFTGPPIAVVSGFFTSRADVSAPVFGLLNATKWSTGEAFRWWVAHDLKIWGARALAVFFPPPPLEKDDTMDPRWGPHLRRGRVATAFMEERGSWLPQVSLVLGLVCFAIAGAPVLPVLTTGGGLMMMREWLFGTPEDHLRKVGWRDIRHALVVVWMQCDFSEALFLTALLLTLDTDRYAEVLGYMWRRPSLLKFRLVNLVAFTFGLTAFGWATRWFWRNRSGARISPHGSMLSTWEPKAVKPWQNQITHYHDPAVGAVTQISKQTATQAIESRVAAFTDGVGGWSNAFAISRDVFLVASHTLPPCLPAQIEVYHHSRRQHRVEPLTVHLLPEHVVVLGGENSLVRFVGVKVVSSCVSLFQSEHAMSNNFEVKCSSRTPTSEPVTLDYQSYGKVTSSFTHRGVYNEVRGCSAVGVSSPGMCGSPVYSLDPRTTILGIHFAGDSTRAYSTRVSAEALARGLEKLAVGQLIPSPPDVPPGFYTKLAREPDMVSVVPHAKSAFNNEDLCVDFLFREAGGSAKPTTRVMPTKCAPVFDWLAREEGLDLSPPTMAPILRDGLWVDPTTRFLKGLTEEKGVDCEAFKRTLECLLQFVPPQLPNRLPLSTYETLNGTPGRGGLTKLNLDTSSGGHHGGSKHALFSRDPNGVITASPQVLQALAKRREEASRNEMPTNFFGCAFKDEPVARAKALAGDTRVIQVPEVSYTLALRQFASVPLMNALSAIPEVAVGMNCYSEEGTNWVKRMEGHGQYMDVDIKRLDRSFGAFDFYLCVAFTLECAKRSGYSAEDLLILKSLLFGLFKPVFNTRGSYFIAESLNASGHPLTVLWNSVVCLSLYVDVFSDYCNKPLFSVAEFRLTLTVSVYGDDGALRCPHHWTFGGIVHTFAKRGFIATPGRKDAVTGAVTDITHLSFLKRYPRYHEELGCWVMALSKKSIAKMVSWKVASKWISARDQETYMVTNALWEAFLWDRIFFDRFLWSVKETGLALDMPMPTVETVLNRFRTGEFPMPEMDIEEVVDLDEYFPSQAAVDPLPKVSTAVSNAVIQIPEMSSAGDAVRPVVAQAAISLPLFRGCVSQDAKELGASPHGRDGLGVKQSSASNQNLPLGVKETPTPIDSTASKNESQPVTIGAVGTTMPSGGPTSFLDETPTAHMMPTTSFIADPDLCHPAVDQIPFLERPLLLYTIPWEAATTDAEMYPLTDWAARSIIAEKMKNFLGIRGKMHFRFVLNGTKQNYGRMMFSLEPYPRYFSERFVGSTAAAQYGDTNYSQMRNVMLDPSCNQSMEMELPFMGFSEFYSLYDEDERVSYGNVVKLRYHAMSPLRTVATVNNSLTVQVYMWWSEVSLVGIGDVVAVTPQSAQAEFSPGVITKVATTIGAAAAAVKDIVPTMRPFFLATEVVASAVGKMAGALGYSQPTQVTPPIFVKQRNVGNLATGIGLDLSDKLALDPHAQVSVDPRIVVGSNTDDMLLSSVATRLSYVKTTVWSSSSPLLAPLVRIPVTPSINFTESSFYTNFTACGFACAPFDYWRGDMIYELDIVASQFHSGRLRVSWIPTNAAKDFGEDLMTTNLTWIIDIATQRKVRIRVPFFGPRAYLRVGDPRDGFLPDVGSSDINGILILSPETALVSPGDVDVIDILISVAAAPNMEFAVMDSSEIDAYWYDPIAEGARAAPVEVQPQSGRLTDDCKVVEICLGTPTGVPDLSAVYFGERITSIRQIIKRSVLYHQGIYKLGSLPEKDGMSFYHAYLPAYPFPSGYGEGRLDWTPLSWFSQGFLAVRGGMRWRATLANVEGYLPSIATRVNATEGASFHDPQPTRLDVTGTDTGAVYDDGWSGQSEASQDQFVNVELPHTSTVKWLPAPFPNRKDTSRAGMSGVAAGRVELLFGPSPRLVGEPSDVDSFYYRVWCAAADDVSLTWFVCAPTVQY